MESKFTPVTLRISDVLDPKKFSVPRYQRSVVWPRTRQINFINTVRNGNPFGVILVRLKDDKYELVDGLQRITTLKRYMENKYDYLSFEDVDYDLTSKIFEEDYQIKGYAVTKDTKNHHERVDSLRKDIFKLLKEGKKNYNIMTSLRQNYTFDDCDAINNAIDSVLERFSASTDISGIPIIGINYTGDEAEIPDVFYNLNTGGATLSKYDTYAALWAKDSYKVDDEEIIDAIMTKYNEINSASKLVVEVEKEDLLTNGINLYEYCYAISMILRSNNKEIFGDSVGDKTDSLGFELLSLIAGEDVNKANKLKDHFKDAPVDFFVKLKNTIKKCANDIQDALSDVVISISGKSLRSESDYLIYHIMYSYLTEYYTIDFKTYKISENKGAEKRDKFDRYVKYWYVNDTLSLYWKTNRQVSDFMRDIRNHDKRRKYWNRVPDDEWEEMMYEFMKPQSTKVNVDYNNRLFIDFYYKLKLYGNPQMKYIFKTELGKLEKVNEDIEHIVTQEKCKQQIKDLPVNEKKKYPISHIGNLCYLTSTENRSKGAKDIYEAIDKKPSLTVNEEYLDFLKYPKREELNFTDYPFEAFDKHYIEFINTRAKEIRSEVLDMLKKKQ